MRILLSCLQSKEVHPIPAYAFWRSYFVNGCLEAGAECLEVPEVDWAKALLPLPEEELKSWRSDAWEKTLRFARNEHARKPIDLFLGYLYPRQIEVEAVTQLQTLGIPCVNFFCDNVREFRRVPAEYSPFALHWVPEFEALGMYRKAGLPFLHAPMPCWVPKQLRSLPQEETEPATFVGSADVLRRRLVAEAWEQGADFVVRGPGWESGSEELGVPDSAPRSKTRTISNQVALVREQGIRALCVKVSDRMFPVKPPAITSVKIQPAVFGAEYQRVTRQAEVIIGINRVPTARRSNRNPLTYSRLRDIEAPMLGACYLTEWTEGIEFLYDPGTEIETYKTPAELKDKLDFLAGNPEKRQAMRRLAQTRALKEHGVPQTLEKIAGQMNLQKR